MKKVFLFFSILFLLTNPSCSFSQTSKWEPVKLKLEVISCDGNEEIEFELFVIEENQSVKDTLIINKQKTPYYLESTSKVFIAIIRSDNYDKIKSSLVSFGSENNVLTRTEGTAPRCILENKRGILSFQGL